ncbi:MAG: phosphatidylglycerophosphatase A [Acidobacteriota bacterium]|nr:phosphatidylglycerophosphatase A [Acidobacteriota bacterium]
MGSATPHRPTHTKAPRVAWWIATGFGSGRLRPAPGTWGSLAALLVWALGANLLRGGYTATVLLGLTAPLLMTGIGIWASDRVVVETGVGDPAFVVADEWAGQWIALVPLLFTGALQTPRWAWHLAVPFLLFRLFDIWKPGPVDATQRLPGGWGVVLDDVVAGLFAALLTWPVDVGLLHLLH